MARIWACIGMGLQAILDDLYYFYATSGGKTWAAFVGTFRGVYVLCSLDNSFFTLHFIHNVKFYIIIEFKDFIREVFKVINTLLLYKKYR